MNGHPLKSLAEYSRHIAELLDRPDIKRHRVPAPEIRFTRPNLPLLIREIEELAKSGSG